MARTLQPSLPAAAAAAAAAATRRGLQPPAVCQQPPAGYRLSRGGVAPRARQKARNAVDPSAPRTSPGRGRPACFLGPQGQGTDLGRVNGAQQLNSEGRVQGEHAATAPPNARLPARHALFQQSQVGVLGLLGGLGACGGATWAGLRLMQRRTIGGPRAPRRPGSGPGSVWQQPRPLCGDQRRQAWAAASAPAGWRPAGAEAASAASGRQCGARGMPDGPRRPPALPPPLVPAGRRCGEQSTTMGRMHSNGKGKSRSALPYKRSSPSWLKITTTEVRARMRRDSARLRAVPPAWRASQPAAQPAHVATVPSHFSAGGRHDRQAGQEGHDPLPDRRAAARQPRHCPGQERHRLQDPAHPQGPG